MELPLARLRVVDLTEGDARYCGRYLADLGAQVILVEPPGETARVLPCAGDDEWCVIDVRDEGDRTRLAALVEGTDLDRWTSVRRPDDVMAASRSARLSPADIDRQVHDGVLQEGNVS